MSYYACSTVRALGARGPIALLLGPELVVILLCMRQALPQNQCSQTGLAAVLLAAVFTCCLPRRCSPSFPLSLSPGPRLPPKP